MGQTLTWNGSSFGLAVAGATSVKLFGATGNGTNDDTAAIQNALAFMHMNGGCIYFPAGVYKTTAELDWINMLTTSGTASPLCLRGDSWRSSNIVYSGNVSVDAAIHVENTYPPSQTMTALDITNLGIAANANAKYALHAISVGPPANVDNVAFAGGSLSSFQGDAWNGVSDLRNLLVSPQFFAPTGSSACVNGLTFNSGISSNNGLTIPSSQFTLTMPTVVGCSGIGLNLQQVYGVAINGGQISGNHQNVYQNCTLGPLGMCQAMGLTFNNLLDESSQVPTQIFGDRNLLNGYYADTNPVQISGYNNVILASQGSFQTQSGAQNTEFLANLIWTTSSDVGTNTFGTGNQAQAGGLAGAPWNSIFPMIRGNITLTSASIDTSTLTGVTSSSVCSFSATNSTATSVQPWYTVGTNSFALHHSGGAGASYVAMCTPN